MRGRRRPAGVPDSVWQQRPAQPVGRCGREEAAALLAEALERYQQAGADAWAGRVRAWLGALGVRPGPRGPRHRPAGGWESLGVPNRVALAALADHLIK